MSTDTKPPGLSQPELDVLVVGAGFCGLYQLHRYRQAGFSVKLFEAGSGLGGIWHWNCYPGARVDSDFSVYQYSMEELWRGWTWTERFPGQKELAAYFAYVDKKLDLRRDILLDTRVTSARFDTSTNRWTVSTGNGITARPRFLVLCTGFGARPIFPEYKGLDTFKGIVHHTALWPQEGVDLKGKRIGVLGTGATGVQVIQEVGQDAGHLTVFQRTPNLALPMVQHGVDEETQAKMKEELYPIIFRRRRQTFAGFHYDFNFYEVEKTTFEERHILYGDLWAKGGFGLWLSNYPAYLSDQKLNDEVYAFWKTKVRERLRDPEMQRKLAPDVPPHPFGVKRPALEQHYYETYNLPHVDLVDVNENPLVEITPSGVKTADGVEHKLDVLVLATGFDAVSGSMTQIDIRGTDGVTLAEKWKTGVTTYLGMTTTNFPNMFFPYGPHGPTAFCNGPTCAEVQGDWIIDCIKYMRAHKLERIEPDKERESEFTEAVHQFAVGGLWHKAKSWYLGANVPGKKIETLNYMGGLQLYTKTFQESTDNGYRGFVFSGGSTTPPNA